MNAIPRIVWIYWDQGWETAPELVRTCLKTWENLNPTWDIRVLSGENLGQYLDLEKDIPGIGQKEITLASLSDILRICLLRKYGGVWADSTLLCRIPLDQWLEGYLTEGFFAFSRPAEDRMVSSWFLAAAEENPVIQAWYRATVAYWDGRSSSPEYFWFHYLFNELYASDAEVKGAWDRAPKIPAAEPHYFIPYRKKFFETLDDESLHRIDKLNTPVFKLTHKYDQAVDYRGTALEYLFDRDRGGTNGRILVAWYGSFEKNGTLGDYLSVKVLTNFLRDKGYDFDCACYKDFPGLGPGQCRLGEALLRPYSVLLFCCGPIIRKHPHLATLFGSFSHLRKIGVGVSLLPEGHGNFYNPFDTVLARENHSRTFEDLAILALPDPELKKTEKKRTGLALRGKQTEYGTALCHWEEAARLFREVAEQYDRLRTGKLRRWMQALTGHRHTLEIDHHLHSSGLDPAEIDRQYGHCDLILTTRFHGAIMALRHGIPVLAVDQIEGGAKVSNLLKNMGYPFVWRIEEASGEKLHQAAKDLSLGMNRDIVVQCRDRAMERAMLTLQELDEQLKKISG